MATKRVICSASIRSAYRTAPLLHLLQPLLRHFWSVKTVRSTLRDLRPLKGGQIRHPGMGLRYTYQGPSGSDALCPHGPLKGATYSSFVQNSSHFFQSWVRLFIYLVYPGVVYREENYLQMTIFKWHDDYSIGPRPHQAPRTVRLFTKLLACWYMYIYRVCSV